MHQADLARHTGAEGCAGMCSHAAAERDGATAHGACHVCDAAGHHGAVQPHARSPHPLAARHRPRRHRHTGARTCPYTLIPLCNKDCPRLICLLHRIPQPCHSNCCHQFVPAQPSRHCLCCCGLDVALEQFWVPGLTATASVARLEMESELNCVHMGPRLPFTLHD